MGKLSWYVHLKTATSLVQQTFSHLQYVSQQVILKMYICAFLYFIVYCRHISCNEDLTVLIVFFGLLLLYSLSDITNAK